MLDLNIFAGCRVVESELLTKTITWRTERKWSHRKRYKPGEAFTCHAKQVPDMNSFWNLGDRIVVHPAVAQLIRDNDIPTLKMEFNLGQIRKPINIAFGIPSQGFDPWRPDGLLRESWSAFKFN
jgi:hypothetical protein